MQFFNLAPFPRSSLKWINNNNFAPNLAPNSPLQSRPFAVKSEIFNRHSNSKYRFNNHLSPKQDVQSLRFQTQRSLPVSQLNTIRGTLLFVQNSLSTDQRSEIQQPSSITFISTSQAKFRLWSYPSSLSHVIPAYTILTQFSINSAAFTIILIRFKKPKIVSFRLSRKPIRSPLILLSSKEFSTKLKVKNSPTL